MTKFNIVNLLDEIATSISADSSIQAWSNSNFSKNLTVDVGYNPETPPGQEDMPRVVIFLCNRVQNKMLEADISIGCMISEDNIDNSVANVKKYTGWYRVEELADMVEDCIYRSGIGSVQPGGETENQCRFPIFETISTIKIMIPQVGRR